MGAGCADYSEKSSLCQFMEKNNFDFDFQNSISSEKEAGVDFEFVRLTTHWIDSTHIIAYGL
jgi:hypothetical protein